MIGKIEIRNFKNLSNISLPLERINVLIGANNSGKSSILQAIQFAVSVAQTTNFENTRWNRTSHRLSTSLTPEQLIYAPLRDVYSLAKGGRLKTELLTAITVVFYDRDQNNSCKVLIRKGKNKNISTEIHNEDIGNQLRNIDSPFSIYVPGLAGIPGCEELKSAGIVTRAAARGDANNVFRNIIWLLHSRPQDWARFCENIQTIFPDVEIKALFSPDRDEFLDIKIKKGDTVLPIDAAGTGFLQIVQILSYINVYKPKLLLLDEPDAHLHPNNQRKLIKLLESLAEAQDFQVIISTHSRHLYDELTPIAHVNWVDSGAINEEEKGVIDILMGLGALDKIDLQHNVNAKLVVLTEDEIQDPIKALIESSSIIMDEIEVWSYKGCTDTKTANVLSSYILRHYPNVKIVIHRDRDYFTDDELSEIFEKYCDGIHYKFITTGNDSETHFINAEHINYLYPNISIDRANELILEACETRKNNSKEKIINLLTERSLKKKGKPNAGANAIAVDNDLAENLIGYSHGKAIIGTLRSLLQRELRQNVNLYKSSPYIATDIFNQIKAELWP